MTFLSQNIGYFDTESSAPHRKCPPPHVRCEQQPRKLLRRRGWLSEMPTPNSKALPKSSEDHSTFATKSGKKHPKHQEYPVETNGRVPLCVPFATPKSAQSTQHFKNWASGDRGHLPCRRDRARHSSLLRPRTQSDPNSAHGVLSNVNQSVNHLSFIGSNDCLITLPSCPGSQWGRQLTRERKETGRTEPQCI